MVRIAAWASVLVGLVGLVGVRVRGCSVYFSFFDDLVLRYSR